MRNKVKMFNLKRFVEPTQASALKLHASVNIACSLKWWCIQDLVLSCLVQSLELIGLSVKWLELIGLSVKSLELIGLSVKSLELIGLSVKWLELIGLSVKWLELIGLSVKSLELIGLSVKWLELIGLSVKWLELIGLSVKSLELIGLSVKRANPANNDLWFHISEFTSSTGSIHVNSPDSVNKFGVFTVKSQFFMWWLVPVKPYQFWPSTTRVKLDQNLWQQAEHVYSLEYTWKHILVERYQLWTSMMHANWFRNGSLFAGKVRALCCCVESWARMFALCSVCWLVWMSSWL